MANAVRGVRVSMPTERESADDMRPVRLDVAGVAYADLTPDEAERIAYFLNYYARQARRG